MRLPPEWVIYSITSVVMRAIRGGERLYQNNVFLCRYCSHFQTWQGTVVTKDSNYISDSWKMCCCCHCCKPPKLTLGVSHKCLYSDRAESAATAAAWGGGLVPHASLTSTPWFPSPPLCWVIAPSLPSQMCSLTSHLSSILANWISFTHELSLLLSRVTSNH